MMRRGFGPWRLLLPLLLIAGATAALLQVRQFEEDQSAMESVLQASAHLNDCPMGAHKYETPREVMRSLAPADA